MGGLRTRKPKYPTMGWPKVRGSGFAFFAAKGLGLRLPIGFKYLTIWARLLWAIVVAVVNLSN